MKTRRRNRTKGKKKTGKRNEVVRGRRGDRETKLRKGKGSVKGKKRKVERERQDGSKEES